MSSSYGAKNKARLVYCSATMDHNYIWDKLKGSTLNLADKTRSIQKSILELYKKSYNRLKTDKQRMIFSEQLYIEIYGGLV